MYTNANISDQVQAYAAGLAEGALTREMIAMYWHNTYKGYCKKPLTGFCKKLQHYFDDNLQWVGEQIHQHADSDPYWHQASYQVEIKQYYVVNLLCVLHHSI